MRRIYYKSNGIATVVMGASFRSTGQIAALAGCDRLTIAPNLLDELADPGAPLPCRLAPDTVAAMAPIPMAEADFRWAMNEDAMATEKAAEGIRNFHADLLKLERIIADWFRSAGARPHWNCRAKGPAFPEQVPGCMRIGAGSSACDRWRRPRVRADGDLPLNFHPTATGARFLFTPVGAVS